MGSYYERVGTRVDYSLSAAGEELMPIMGRMAEWAGLHLGMVPTLPLREAGSALSTRVN